MFTLIYDWNRVHSKKKECKQPKLCFQCGVVEYIQNYERYYLNSKLYEEKIDWKPFQEDIIKICVYFGIGVDTTLIESLKTICVDLNMDTEFIKRSMNCLQSNLNDITKIVSRRFKPIAFKSMIDYMNQQYSKSESDDEEDDLNLIIKGVKRL